MNRSSFALSIALLIHLLFLLVYLRLESIEFNKKVPTPENKIKISLKELPKKKLIKKKKNISNEKKVKPPEIAPPMPKGSQLKKIVKYEPKAKVKKTKLNPRPKIKKRIVKTKKTEPVPPKKPYIPLVKPKQKMTVPKKKKETSSMDWLLQDKSDEIRTEDKVKKFRGASASRDIKKLYGSDFGKLSAGQQKYILDNQEIMRRITQQVLNRQARVSDIDSINVNRTNTIEFYLHPNGDISDFRFLETSGYFMLDDITKATIEYAYSKYPRPTEKTLIRYNVFYNLAR